MALTGDRPWLNYCGRERLPEQRVAPVYTLRHVQEGRTHRKKGPCPRQTNDRPAAPGRRPP